MSFLESFLHFFTPRHTNNHRAKALHLSSIFFYITALLIFQVGLTAVTGLRPEVLGYASNISINDLLKETNSRRTASGVHSLVLNDQLSMAASAKAKDMFSDQYWAHNSPKGRDPWDFIVEAGYSYLFAGENLARDFGSSKGVVDAWMSSASHRENLLSDRYQDVGFAVVNGKYGNNETTLVVQMFGTKPGGVPSVEPDEVGSKELGVGGIQKESSESGIVLNTKMTPFGLTKGLSTALIVLLVGVLLIDGFLVYKRKTVRLSGHNLAHLLILIAVLVAINLIGRGAVL